MEQAEAGQLIPVLKDLFQQAQKEERRAPIAGDIFQLSVVPDQAARIATKLVALGDQDILYWDFLVKLAMPAIESEAPDDATSVDSRALFNSLSYLVNSGDPRAIPLLRRALKSPSLNVRSMAADGLAQLQDNPSIPAIIELCHGSLAQQGLACADMLERFHDPSAQAAAAALRPKPDDPVQSLTNADFNDEVAVSYNIEQIAKQHRLEAIPLLKQHFETASNPLVKDKLASVLVRLDVKENIYWDYLVEQAMPALASDAPPMMSLDGDHDTGLSKTYVAWAKARNYSLPADAFYRIPGRAIELAITGDPRGVPLLREAMASHTDSTRLIAIMGLIQANDTASIPALIELCQGATAEDAKFFAMDLMYFKDPRAQAEAVKHLAPKLADEIRKRVAQGIGPFGQ